MIVVTTMSASPMRPNRTAVAREGIDLTLIPLNRVFDERYVVYWNVNRA